MSRLNPEEVHWLLRLARQAMEAAVRGEPEPPFDLEALPAVLREPAATFVTLTRRGELRGCIGALEARQPLVADAREHAVAAALHDFRFPPVQPSELPDIHLEVSVLSPLQPLSYKAPEDLLRCLRPGVDGVLIRRGLWQRATFLPQVWEKVTDPADFLSHLCLKMGAPPDTWRHEPLQVFTYQVEVYEEEAA